MKLMIGSSVKLNPPEPALMPVTVRVTPDSVIALLARRKDRGCDPDLDHAELFVRGGVILRGPSNKPALLMYSIEKTGFYIRASCHADIHAYLLAEEAHA